MICKSCHSDDIREEKEFATFNPDTDKYEIVHGFMCLECGCFMEKNGTFYDFTPSDLLLSKNCFK